MPTLRSSVLIIGHPVPSAIAFGADFAADFNEAKKSVSLYGYPVIVLPSSVKDSAAAVSLLEFVNEASPLSQRVIIQNDTPVENLRRLINTGQVFRILPAYTDKGFDLTIQEALEEYSLLQQNSKLLQLVHEQNEKLKKLNFELEGHVENRKRSLLEAKERLLVTNDRVEALHRALVAIHRAGSIAEMERLINEALSGALGLSWTRILFQSQARLGEQSVSLFIAPLMRGKETLGHISFARPKESPFTRDETGFLTQVADAVSLAIDRLTKLEQSETLKHQWEATFDAILEPVSLLTSDFTVIRINRSFAERSGTSPENVIGRKCYQALFNRTTPCDGCAIHQEKLAAQKSTSSEGKNFRLKPAKTAGGQNVIYDVFSQKIEPQVPSRGGDDTLFVNMYHDVTSQLSFERQILESAKMAELGTIGSSIAHELNNPLGGMLSFLQLIKMDLKGNEPWFADIDEMEKGARRCRDIVQSLLGFTRKSGTDTVEIVDLNEVIEQALKITELQTRAMGITVVYEVPKAHAEVRGQFNALAQALRNFLQNSQEAIAEKMRVKKSQGEIRIRMSSNDERHLIEIEDNGVGFDADAEELIFNPMYTTKNSSHNPGLGLTVSSQIIKDHGGGLEIRSTKGLGTSAKISLPRPVFDP